ncbi:TlpA family protein disulfide reductase [Henriciella aquimarina]|uniref:TlpA family protein disulfide reductase n=1 Tax=Henriciella aquimarina TaxID=545261 RepID=UPI000A0293FF|nr:TlpA disulfide reductase family protein [Henriciella aquimarina]
MSRVLKFAIPALIAGLVLAVSYALLSATSKGGNTDPIGKLATGSLEKLDVSNRGEPVTEATFEGPDGQEMTLGDFKGQTILVNFWATWCSPCEREMPSLGSLEAQKGSDDFKVIAISVDASEDKDYARERLGELSGGVLDFYFAPPENWDIVYDAGAKGFPTSVIYDETGAEIARLSGEAEWDSYEAAALVDAITAD